CGRWPRRHRIRGLGPQWNASTRGVAGRDSRSRFRARHSPDHPFAARQPTLYRRGMSIRIVIAEDQAMVLGALAALLETEDDITVVGQARNGREALRLVLSEKPDVLLSDIE